MPEKQYFIEETIIHGIQGAGIRLEVDIGRAEVSESEGKIVCCIPV